MGYARLLTALFTNGKWACFRLRYRRSEAKKSPEIEAELKYLQRNRMLMDYFELQQSNLPIGSGVVKAACKNIIGARMKKPGM